MVGSSNNDLLRLNSSYKAMKKLLVLTPLILLFVLCLFLLIYLLTGKDPNKPPSALLL